jgi:hypothetical protein
MMKTAIVIHAFPRCGSTAIGALIDEHPEAVCIQYPFDAPGPAAVKRDNFHFLEETGGPWREDEPKKDYILRKLYNCTEPGIELVAMKTVLGALGSEKEWLAAKADMKKVCVWREDFLASFVSTVEFVDYGRGQHRGLPGTRAEISLSIVSDWYKKVPEKDKVVVLPGQVESYFKAYTRNNAEMKKAFPDALMIEYQQLLDDPDKLAKDIFAFLGLPDRGVKFPTVKVNTAPLHDRVENYDEMVVAFQACKSRLN